MNKKTILFHLKRRLRELSDTQPDPIAMAKQGLSYAERQKKEAEADKYKGELEALESTIAFVTEKMPEEGPGDHKS